MIVQRVSLFLFAVGFVASSATVADDNPNLWILSGQSNACGRAKLPGPEPDPRVKMFDFQNNKYIVAQDPLPGMGTTGTGPWVAAAQAVAGAGHEISMLGFASGGKPISYWHPGHPGDKGLMPPIDRAGQGAGVFLWYQGENNTVDGTTREGYIRELKEHIARVRGRANNPKMLVLVVQLGPDIRRTNSGYMTIREAQRQFVLADEHAILVPALGRTLKDSVHLDNTGYRELGTEIGRALLRHRFKNADINWPGPVLDKATLGDNRTTVVAHFAEVGQLSGVAVEDFGVIDEEGTVHCTVAKTGKTLITLTTERTVRLPARLIYGFGQNPRANLLDEAGNRAPAVQLSITSAKAPIDEPTTAPNGAGK